MTIKLAVLYYTELLLCIIWDTLYKTYMYNLSINSKFLFQNKFLLDFSWFHTVLVHFSKPAFNSTTTEYVADMHLVWPFCTRSKTVSQEYMLTYHASYTNNMLCQKEMWCEDAPISHQLSSNKQRKRILRTFYLVEFLHYNKSKTLNGMKKNMLLILCHTVL